MKRVSAVFLVVVCALLARAQDHPNTARGFNSESTYQFGGIDNVNVYNGNLIVPIPIGQTYHVGGNLSYGLTLVYNGQLWSYRANEDLVVSYAVPQPQFNVALGWQLTLGELYGPQYTAHPLILPDDHWAYLGPDGSRNMFYPTLHAEEADNPAFDARHDQHDVEGYTRDSSYMRLVKTVVTSDLAQIPCVVNRYTVEKADGTRHLFRSGCRENQDDPKGHTLRYFLERIEDRFGNKVDIAYAPQAADPANATQWIITDNSGAGTARTHYVHLARLKFNSYRAYRDDAPEYTESRSVVTKVDLAAFDGTRAVYQFANDTDSHYRPLSEPCKSGLRDHTTRKSEARFLDAVILPDGSKYEMKEYERGDFGTTCHDGAGHLVVFQLPTGGRIEYAVHTRFFPQYWPKPVEDGFHSQPVGAPNYWDLPSPINDAYKGFYDPASDMRHDGRTQFSSPYYSSVAVVERRFFRESSPPAGEAWSYWTCYRSRTPRDPNVNEPQKPRELVVAVDDPTGRRTLSYFTVDLLQRNDAEYPGGKRIEYGLPFTRASTAKPSPVSGFFLSTELLDRALPKPDLPVCQIAFDDNRVVQRTYVRYEYDATAPEAKDDTNGGQPDSNRRLTGTLTVQRKYDAATDKWVDDTSCGGNVCYSLVEYSDFDGLGHHREETRRTNIGAAPDRTTITRWRRPGKDPVTYVPGAGNVPADYMIPVTAKWLPNFHDQTSVVEGTTNAVTSEVCLDPDTGFLEGRRIFRSATKELLTTYQHVRGNVTRESFFGGETKAPADTCNGGTTPTYQLSHEWSYGARARTQSVGVTPPFYALDLTVDPATGLASVSRDTAGVATTYTYDALGRLTKVVPTGAASTTYTYKTTERPARVTAVQGDSLTESHYYYDAFGRLLQEKRRLPGGWATIGRTYDAAGRLTSQTVPTFFGTGAYSPGFTAKRSVFELDVFDRNTKTTAPDGSIAETAYGSSGGWRTVQRTLTKAAAVAALKEETYDGFGRLRSVSDFFDKVTPTTTWYSYDVGDRLSHVAAGTAADDDAQERVFTYDLAGLLVSEDHPESAPTTYTYDARGHVLTRKTGNASSLRFVYDEAERVTKVYDKEQLSKELHYGTGTTDLGRLQSQTRHNRFAEATFTVTDTFTYDAAGRVGSKQTAVTETPLNGTPVQQAFTQQYSYTQLSAPAALHYPTCTACVAPPPTRDLALQYKDGLLTNIAQVTAPIVSAVDLDTREDDADPGRPSIAYSAAGAVRYVQHASPLGAGALDTYEPDPNGLPRPARITVTSIPECNLITSQPTDQQVGSDSTATFTLVVADGATVQWYEGQQHDTTKVRGTGTTYKTPPLGATTPFWARVTSSGSSCIQSTPTVLARFCPPVQVTRPAVDETAVTELKVGSSITFAVVATGESLTYRWDKVDEQSGEVFPLVGSAPSFTYTVADDKTYKVRVTVAGACGTPVTRVVGRVKGALEPCVARWLMQPPGAVEVLPGESFPLQAMLDSTAGTYRFRWSRDGVEVYDPGAGTSPNSTFSFTVQTAAVVRVEAWAVCGTNKSESVFAQTFGIVRGSCPPPAFTLNQKAATVQTGQPTISFVLHSDWPGLRHEWYVGESGDTRRPITDVTGNVLTVDAHAETYWVRVINECGAHADSETLTVSGPSCTPVRIRRDPASAEIAAGASHTLSVDASSTPLPYSYQWYVDGVPVAGPEGKGASYTVRPKKSATYWVEVQNTCHVALSRVATVHVTSCVDVAVTAQPQDASVNEGATVSLTIEASGASPIFYQWYEGESGDTSTPVAGAQSKTLTLQPAQTKRYWVRLSFASAGSCSVDSRTVTVNVCRTPVFVQQTANQSSSTPGQQHTLGVTFTGDRLSYAWFRGEKGDESAPIASGFDIVRVAPNVTTKYWARVTSDCTNVPDAVQRTEPIVVSVCPEITQHPQPATVMPGTSAVLTIAASRGDTIEWYRGASHDTSSGVLGRGASFTTPPVSAATQFWARVTSGFCQRDSSAATVSICGEPHVSWSASIRKNVASGEAQTIGIVVTPSSGVYRTFYEGQSGDVANSRKLLGPGGDGGLPIAPTQTTSYWVRAQMVDGSCYKDTPTLTINVCVPTITAPPQSVMIDKISNPSASATLSVTATGGALTYQWYEGATDDTTRPIAGATASTITVSPSAQTSYWVRVTGSCDVSVSSPAAIVSLCEKPAISQQSASMTVTKGTTHTISVTATGTELVYQWYQGATGVTTTPVGTNSPSYTATISETIDYWVRVSGRCGAAVNSATIKMSVAPTITTQPAGVSVTKGSTATFTVAASGTQLAYQWYAGSGTAAPISGATASSYTTGALTSDVTVWCRVRSGAASTDSSAATATVCQPRSVTTTYTTQVSGSQVTLSVTGGAQPNETYEWYAGDSGNTSRKIYTGATAVLYPNDTTNIWMRTVRPTCTADGATVTVVVCYPKITTQPLGGTINPGSSMVLSVAASGTPPLSYQWYVGPSGTTTNPVAGATSSSYTAAPSDDTTYWVQVRSASAGAGCVTNSNATVVSVCKPAAMTSPPSSVVVTKGSSHTMAAVVTGTNLTYQWYRGLSGDTSTPVCTNSANCTVIMNATTDYWVRVTAQCGAPVSSATAKISVAPTIDTHPASVAINKGTSTTLTVAASGAQLAYQWYLGSGTANPIAGATAASYNTGALQSTTSYWVHVTSGATGASSNVATVTVCQPRATNVVHTTQVSGSQVTLAVSGGAVAGESYQWFRGETGDTANPVGSTASTSVYPTATTRYWLRTTFPSGCSGDSPAMTATVCTPAITAQPAGRMITRGNSATLSVAATGNTPLAYQWYVGESGNMAAPIAGATSASLVVSPTATTSYWVYVSSSSSCAVASATATVAVCQPPVITQQPVGGQTTSTGTATIEVVATGDGLTYQWYEGSAGVTTTPVGVNSPTLSIVPGTTKSYWVRITGTCGSADSTAALISIYPTIRTQPADVSVCSGRSATFTVSASGSPLEYQWYAGTYPDVSQPIAGANSATLTLSSVTATRSVWCEVRSGTATTSTRTATATVLAGPTVLAPAKTYNSGCYTLSARVSSTDEGRVSYAWYRGAIGDTSYFITTSKTTTVCPSTSTQYWVRVTYLDSPNCSTDRAVTVP